MTTDRLATDDPQPATCNFHVRPATPTDIPNILSFIRELAEYEREPASAIAAEADLLRDGFGPTPRFTCVIAEIKEHSGKSPATSSPRTWDRIPYARQVEVVELFHVDE